MTHPVDPWASTDHDPSSSTEDMTNSGEIHTTTQTLAFARADIHTGAVLSHANTVLLAADAIDEQRRYAGYYQEDALAMIAGA